MFSATKAVLLCALMGLLGCSSLHVDLDRLSLLGIPLTPELVPQDVINLLGPPDEETKSKRWLWRAPRDHL